MSRHRLLPVSSAVALALATLSLGAGGAAHAATTLALAGGDSEMADDTLIDLQLVLEDEGYVVDIVVAADIDTLAEIEAYDAVLIGDSGYGDNDWADFDTVLDDYVDGGGGLLMSGWVPYFASSGSEPNLVDLLPVSPSTSLESGGTTITATGSDEPADGWASFVIPSAAYSNHGGGTRSGASVAATTSDGNDSVTFWEFGDGRVLHHSANYLVDEGVYGHSALYDGSDADALQSFLTAVSWVSGGECSTAPVVALESGGANADDTFPEIQTALEDLGWTVEIVEAADVDTLAEIEVYDAVFLGDSGYSDSDWTDFDDVLLDYVDGGGGLLLSGWVAYFCTLDASAYPNLCELSPVETWTSFETERTVTAESGSEVADGWSAFDVTGNLDIPETVKSGATVAAYDDAGDAAIVHWGYGDGRVIFLSPNYLVSTGAYGHDYLFDGSDADAWQAFLEAGEWAANTCSTDDPDEDGDGYAASEDCDDSDPDVYPGAEEVCDEVDNDCDDEIDEDDAADAETWYLDDDGDSYGDPDSTAAACERPDGYVANARDCDDSEPLAWTGATEVCDDVDNDCDGGVDVDAVDAGTWYADGDDDTYGDPEVTAEACDRPDGYVANDADCDDDEPLAWTGAAEVCDGVDNDCEGTVDEDAVDASTWYADTDEDSYGDPDATVDSCIEPDGYVDNDGDCDDAEPLAWTGADEVCDEVDNDCDGTVDNDDAIDALTWYADTDEDGYGDGAAPTTACSEPDGYVDNDGDCDDAEPLAWTGADEVCDGVDNDCEGTTDEAAVDAPTWYADGDSDSYTVADDSVTECEAPAGYAAASTEEDCDDGDATIFPGATEVEDDGIDQDCDGADATSDPGDGGTDTGGDDGGDDGGKDDGCGGCASTAGGGAGAAWLLPMLGALLVRRRR